MAEYIDREALRQFPIRKYRYDRINGDERFIFGIEAVLEYAENLPAADVAEVRRGKWKYYHKQNRAVCTECSFERNLDHDFGKAVACPNCGARMDLGGAYDA